MSVLGVEVRDNDVLIVGGVACANTSEMTEFLRDKLSAPNLNVVYIENAEYVAVLRKAAP